MRIFISALKTFFLLTLATGILYPLALNLVGDSFFRSRANGSIIVEHGIAIGTLLVAQKFESPKYFWPRPSAVDYATLPSGASNLGPTSLKLAEFIKVQRHRYGSSAPDNLVTASASGLDPHITRAAAEFQIQRIAAERGISEEDLSRLIAEHVSCRLFESEESSFVNVLELNLELDQLKH
jgi:K+-transporting ATPase ATPase C chain